MINKSPKDRVVPLPNGLLRLIHGDDPNHLLNGSKWDDPPSWLVGISPFSIRKYIFNGFIFDCYVSLLECKCFFFFFWIWLV